MTPKSLLPHPLSHPRDEIVYRYQLLLAGVAMADSHLSSLGVFAIDGHTPRRPDLIVAIVALSDGARLIILGMKMF